jgi:hypothetical protein
MAEQKPVVIFENLMKAYKYDYENASNPLVKTQAKQKANKLREMASLFGIDQKELDLFGPDIKLKDTPGGQSIDYGALAQTGKLWSGRRGRTHNLSPSVASGRPSSLAYRGSAGLLARHREKTLGTVSIFRSPHYGFPLVSPLAPWSRKRQCRLLLGTLQGL